MLYPMKELLVRALDGNYCVIAPSIRNEDCMRAALEAAEEVNSPVILSMNIASRSGFKDGYYLPFQIAVGIQAAMRSKVPVAINCDHAPSFETCALAIKAGMT